MNVGSILSPIESVHNKSVPDKLPSPSWPAGQPQQQQQQHLHTMFSPSSHTNLAATPMVISPITPSNSTDLRHPEHPPTHETGVVNHDDSLASGYLKAGSRRESVDSRFNQQLDNVRLGNSVYGSQNNSATSFQNILNTDKGGAQANGDHSPTTHHVSNGYHPTFHRAPDLKIFRTAPAITGPATGDIARAAEPTKGQAWAFPETDLGQPDSRRSSIADSMTDSYYADQRLPPGQRMLGERHEYVRRSSDLPSQGGPIDRMMQQPYSRSPALRVSHKMAERKRRTEMKELFDHLRDMMPQERGSKASKWEILTKGMCVVYCLFCCPVRLVGSMLDSGANRRGSHCGTCKTTRNYPQPLTR